MAAKKRRLGRGLEALLAGAAMEQGPLQPDVDEASVPALSDSTEVPDGMSAAPACSMPI